MNEKVREILSWYSSENPGVRTNLARLLNHGRLAGTGKLVILPVDQGFEHGPARSFAPNPPAYNPHYHFAPAISREKFRSSSKPRTMTCGGRRKIRTRHCPPACGTRFVSAAVRLASRS